ncbi:MAG TPA: hypothetical protein EYP48_01275 [Ignisphaera sp.]|nr:hypothetical protein [Ignisphaera sp.]
MSRLLSELSKYPIEIRLIIVRGVYGVLIGLILTPLAMTGYIEALPRLFLTEELASYFTWIYLVIFYIPSIYIAKRLRVRRKFDLYFRGILVYLASAILTHIIIASA